MTIGNRTNPPNVEDNPFRLCGECDNYLTLEEYKIGYCDECYPRMKGDL